jgi:hypothetical protein
MNNELLNVNHPLPDKTAFPAATGVGNQKSLLLGCWIGHEYHVLYYPGCILT